MSKNKIQNEIGKYLKKKESNISKVRNKTKHKHIYEDCVFCTKSVKRISGLRLSVGTYCSVCDKIGKNIFPSEKYDTGYSRQLNDEEIKEQYKDLPVFNLSDYWQKYVVLQNK